MKQKSAVQGILILLLACSLFFVSACSAITIPPSVPQSDLPSVAGYQQLVELLQERGDGLGWYPFRGGLDMAESAAPGQARAAGDSAAKGTDYSGTNIQVLGVDEADIIKTDGRYLYMVHENRILIAEIYPANTMRIVKTLSFSQTEFYPSEIYVDGQHLVVIGNTYRHIPIPEPEPEPTLEPEPTEVPVPTPEPEPTEQPPPTQEPEPTEAPEPTDVPEQEPVESGVSEARSASAAATPSAVEGSSDPAPDIWFPTHWTESTVRVLVYGIQDPKQPLMLRDLEIDGYYVSSRKIGSHLYLLSNKGVYYYGDRLGEDVILPWYRDSALKEDFEPVPYDRIRYFPDSQDSSYLLVAGLDLSKQGAPLNVDAYLGAGQTLYASLENLYVAVAKWEYDQPSASESAEDAPVSRIMPWQPSKVSTQIYRFALEGGRAVYGAKGEVPGSLLNQFSMDEHNGHFRIATTTGDMWRTDEFTSQNNLYVLNSSLSITGKIEGIAPGERIYSVRFMGDKGYMVTFKTVDPLFVLDLKDPRQPKILGELKIPGYSDYLHPYDENHLIGFGMDAVEADGIAYQMGMKMALFDVSDVARPKEKFAVSIGDRGTYSELLYNHKALLFSREKNLIAFPVTLMEAKQKWMDADKRIPNYGELAFQGLYVYGLDLQNGFELKARVSHLTPQELKDAHRKWFDYQKGIQRGLYIEDTLYTISQAYVKGHGLSGFEEQGVIKLPYDEKLYR